MTSIFDILKGVLFTKKDPDFSTIEEEKQFDMYMVNRWCSMVDKDCAKIINETTNKFGGCLDSKTSQYRFLKSVLPRYNFHKINYIKRKSVD
jgi:hypothetical protein